jgi:hypothetical protein
MDDKKIKIKCETLEIDASLDNSRTASQIWEKLPIEGIVNIWGEEIYFSIPVKASAENPKAVVELGDLGYWIPGSAFCIFFGKTPASTGNEIRPASPVNVFGKVDLSKIKELKKIKDGSRIVIERPV